MEQDLIIKGAHENNLKHLDLRIHRKDFTIITGVSGSGKSSLAFDTIFMEARRRFFVTLSQYSRQFLERASRPQVQSITGLSPAVAMRQNETSPSRSAKVGSITDLFELFGILFSQFAERQCPNHGTNLSKKSVREIFNSLWDRFGKDGVSEKLIIAMTAPLVKEKKGHYQKQLTAWAERGYTYALIDGQLETLSPVPQLDAGKKHSIELVVDFVNLELKNEKRILKALDSSLELAKGFGTLYLGKKISNLDFSNPIHYGGDGSCPTCGFSWPALDTRSFSPNSLGACLQCDGFGYIGADEVFNRTLCLDCQGTGLKQELQGILYEKIDPLQLHNRSLRDLHALVSNWKNQTRSPGEKKTLNEIHKILQRFVDLKLDYLPLSRPIDQLATGEWQKIRMANVLGSYLKGMIYLFDEPSQGLSADDLTTVINVLKNIQALGGTVIVVDHDEAMMLAADRILDLGPAGGSDGGYLVADFRPKDAGKHAKKSLTAAFLAQRDLKQPIGKKKNLSETKIIKCQRIRNLKIKSLELPRQALTVLHGPSGAGKTTLLFGCIAIQLQIQSPKKEVFIIDRSPIAKSSVSMPVTYLGIYSYIRDLFGELPQAQIAGFSAKDFSLSTGTGRCQECGGRGYLTLTMRYLEDARIKCPVCEGRRFTEEVLEFRFKDHSIHDVLEMTLEQAAELFAHHRKIIKHLQPALDLGLGYLKMGQPTASLSGGENQRLKLVPNFAKSSYEQQTYLFDEPTIGLHFSDTEKLIKILKVMADKGATIIVAENDSQFLAAADCRIQLGEGPGPKGGRVLQSDLKFENFNESGV